MKTVFTLCVATVFLFFMEGAFSTPPIPAFLPEAESDFILAAVGFPDPSVPASSDSPVELPGREDLRSITARAVQSPYPLDIQQITLEITNHSDSDLLYTGYYDLRRLVNGEWIPVNPRADAVFDTTEYTLAAGGVTTQEISLDLYATPLVPGTYRAAQLACFSDTGGSALACTEISGEFQLLEA